MMPGMVEAAPTKPDQSLGVPSSARASPTLPYPWLLGIHRPIAQVFDESTCKTHQTVVRSDVSMNPLVL